MDISKQLQIQKFLQQYEIDILNCQEINLSEDSFSQTNFINSSYQVISNNASNKYGTCCIISNNFNIENIKLDTNGRIIVFDIENTTFGNVYLPSGNEALAKSNRENYAAEVLPSLLVNAKENSCVGGDWNSITENIDATKNASNKKSPCLKRLLKTFSFQDSYRSLHPSA